MCLCVSVICLVEIALEQLEGATSTSTSAATVTATQPRSAIREKAATVVDVETQLIAHCNKQKSLTPPFPLPQAPQHCFQVFTPASVAPLLPPITTCPILFPQRIPHAQRETLCGCSLCVGERRNGNILVFGGRKKEVDNTSVLVASCHPLKRRRHF